MEKLATKQTGLRRVVVLLSLLLCLAAIACAAPPDSPIAETPTPVETLLPEPTPRDVTGNGVADEVDELALQLHADGRLTDLNALPALLQNSLLGERFFDRFCYNGVEQGEGFYRSANISMTLDVISERDLTYYVADIYVRDIACLKTLLAEKAPDRGEEVASMAERSGAVIAISGDYYGARTTGIIIRNGEVLRSSVDQERDACVLYLDGTMVTYAPGEVDIEGINARGAYQAWTFGPALLDADGQPKTTFLSNVKVDNPRSAIGYFEPGHYCFVVVDGRGAGGSEGMTMAELSTLFYTLGCRAAYNFDGGATAVMADKNGMISQQSKPRGCTDIVYIAEPGPVQPEG